MSELDNIYTIDLVESILGYKEYNILFSSISMLKEVVTTMDKESYEAGLLEEVICSIEQLIKKGKKPEPEPTRETLEPDNIPF